MPRSGPSLIRRAGRQHMARANWRNVVPSRLLALSCVLLSSLFHFILWPKTGAGALLTPYILLLSCPAGFAPAFLSFFSRHRSLCALLFSSGAVQLSTVDEPSALRILALFRCESCAIPDLLCCCASRKPANRSGKARILTWRTCADQLVAAMIPSPFALKTSVRLATRTGRFAIVHW